MLEALDPGRLQPAQAQRGGNPGGRRRFGPGTAISDGDSTALPDDLRDWCADILGSAVTAHSRHDHDHGEARVWRLADAAGNSYFLKSHRQPGKWHSETWAYDRWMTIAFGVHAPRLIAARETEPRVLLTSALPGVPMYTLSPTPTQEQAAWEAAGRCLARFHNTATNPWFGSCHRDGSPQSANPPTNAAAFVANNIASNATRATTYLTAADQEFIATAAREWTPQLEGEPAVPIHRDYSPRNWIVDPQTGHWVGAIDFEHARWDVRAGDMQRGSDREWVGRPDLVEAFFAGYGRRLDEKLIGQIKAIRLLHAVGGVRWSMEHRDGPFEAENRATLARLRKEF